MDYTYKQMVMITVFAKVLVLTSLKFESLQRRPDSIYLPIAISLLAICFLANRMQMRTNFAEVLTNRARSSTLCSSSQRRTERSKANLHEAVMELLTFTCHSLRSLLCHQLLSDHNYLYIVTRTDPWIVSVQLALITQSPPNCFYNLAFPFFSSCMCVCACLLVQVFVCACLNSCVWVCVCV